MSDKEFGRFSLGPTILALGKTRAPDSFTFAEQLEECKQVLDTMRDILVRKGAEYNPDGGAFLTHLEAARVFVANPTLRDAARVLHVHFLKHYHAVQSFFRTGVVGMEGVEGHFVDCANYLVLMAVVLRFEERCRDERGDSQGKA